MRFIPRILGGVLGLLLLVALAALVFVFFVTRPQLTGTLSLPGLEGEVKVLRDRWGVPHITATASDADAFHALGFVHAQDRLWQMEFQRRIAQGRLSEVLGPAALEQDKFLRTWGFYRAAQQALPALSERSRSYLSAYTAGVNAAIAQDALPLEFRVLRYRPERWTDVDSLAWQKLMAFDLGGNWEQELAVQNVAGKLGPDAVPTLFPEYPQGAPTILSDEDLLQQPLDPAADVNAGVTLRPETRQALREQLRIAAQLGFSSSPDKGSNNWVLSGQFTESGKPLLANDPHLSLQAPMLWYLAELRGPTLHVIGATVPGLPAVIIGRNGHITWGVTNTGPDVQDLYVEGPDARIVERTEVIKVKGQPDVAFRVRESERGPIISGVGGVTQENVSLQWTALQPGDASMDAFISLAYARDWSEFTRALRSYVGPMQNFVYADRLGNIGYYAAGLIPIRSGWDGSRPVPADEDHRWLGYVPFEELPHVYNPPAGFIVTANNKVAPDGYPHFLTNDATWAEPYRAERILELLREGEKFDVSDMITVQNDVRSLLWEDLRPYLLRAGPLDERSRLALNFLRDWDGVQSRDSVASTVFSAWYAELARMPNDELKQGGHWNEPLFVKQQLRDNGRYCRDATAGIDDCRELLGVTLRSAVERLSDELGPGVDSWRWGRVHRTESRHGAFGGVGPLGWIWNRSVDAAGGQSTVSPGTFDLNTLRMDRGASYRMIVDFGDLNDSVYVGTLGQSGNPFSGHYADQQALWRDGEYVPMSTHPSRWGSTSFLVLEPAR